MCGLEFQFDEAGRLARIRGDAQDPFSRGHICPKGNAILDLENDPDRLQRPLRRRGSAWEEIGWEEAFALAGERLGGIQSSQGADALGVYLGNPNVHHFGSAAYLPPLLRTLRTRNLFSASSVDQWPHQFVSWLMYGHQFLVPIPDLDRTDFFLVLGANPVASNGSLLTTGGIARRLEALRARAGRLVLIDPRRTETAKVADEHLFIRPGTDAWFLIGFLNELRRLGPPRLARYGDRLRGLEEALAAVAPFELAEIAVRTGIAAEDIRRLAAQFWAAPRACIYGRIGVSTQKFGSLCQWLMQLINLVAGQLDAEGGVLPNEPVIPVTGPGTSAGHHDKWRSRVRGLPEFAGELPVVALAEEIVTPGPEQIRGLLTVAGNPVLSTPDGSALERALGSLEFMVSVDIYLNETTRHADLILPPASALTQHHYDLVFSAFAVRRLARWNRPILPLPPDQRGDWEILQRLGQALATAAGKPWQPLPPPESLIPALVAAGGSGVDAEAFAAAEHGLDLGPLRPSLLGRLQTASGCIECAPPILVADLQRLAQEPPADGELRLIGRRHVRSNNSWMHNAPRLVKGAPRHQLLMHPADLTARGLASEEEVEVTCAGRRVVTTVQSSEDMMPGVVSLPHGFGHARPGVRLQTAAQVPGASYNDLSDPTALDVPSGNAALSGLAVQVRRRVESACCGDLKQ